MISWCKIIGYGSTPLLAMMGGLAYGQQTIISVTGPADSNHQWDGALGVSNTLEAVSWTATGAYSNLNISIDLSGDAGATGTAYLTKQIGSGATTASQVVAANFNFPAISSLVPVLSGVNLGAGTYYLIILQTSNGGSGAGSWLGTASPSVAVAGNITTNGEYYSYGTINSYAASSSFGKFSQTYLQYNITVSPVPEPSATSLFLLIGGVAFFGLRRNRIGSHQ